MTNSLKALSEQGQSAWIDYLSRPLVRDGDLARLIDDGIVGVTSNPTIFQSAISSSDEYDDQLREVLASESDAKEVFLALAHDDVCAACDLLDPVFEREGRRATAGCHSRSTRISPMTRMRPRGGAAACTRWSIAATCSSRFPGPRPV